MFVSFDRQDRVPVLGYPTFFLVLRHPVRNTNDGKGLNLIILTVESVPFDDL